MDPLKIVESGKMRSGLPAPVPEHRSADSDFGNFVTNEDQTDDLEFIAEPWHQYGEGDGSDGSRVFYPICLGEVLNGRYLVEHKIGFGGFSTVWMAHDLQEKRDVTLKVMCLGDWAETEACMLEKIIQQDVQDTSHLVTLLDTFLLPRPAGDDRQHKVLVFPLMGPCLCSHVIRKMSIPMATCMSAARQLLEALENLHKAGIVHRDLNERNCMWGLAPLHNLSRSAKYEALGQPLKEKIPLPDLWKQGELVWPLSIHRDILTEEFFLGDFGLAMRVDDPVTQKGYPPMQFCSPDRLHRKHPSFACDMWSYMILFGVLYLGFPPFHSAGADGGIIGDITSVLGPLPEQWKGLYTHPEGRDSWYDQDRKPDHSKLAKTIAYYRPDADPSEQELVLSIMLKVFTRIPEERLSATQLLQDPSFRTLMEKYGC